jgi:hypothetical protein
MNDQQLKQLFAEHKTEIADNGFSDKVTRHLPQRSKTPLIVWIGAVLGSILFFISGAYTYIIDLVFGMFEHQPWWIFPATSAAIAIVFLVSFGLYQHKEQSSYL